MKTLVIFDENTRDVIACVPENKDSILKKGVGIALYDGTEPIFLETENGIKFQKNGFIINLSD